GRGLGVPGVLAGAWGVAKSGRPAPHPAGANSHVAIGSGAAGPHWGGLEPALWLSAASAAGVDPCASPGCAVLRFLPRRLSRSAVWDCTVIQRNSSKPIGGADQPIVFVVDDDDSTRQALARLFYSVQLRTEVFPSTREFLQSERRDVPSCLVLDVRLPG